MTKKKLSRNRLKEEKIVEYHMGQAFLHQVVSKFEISPVLPGWLVDLYALRGGVYRKALKLYSEFQFIGNLKVNLSLESLLKSHIMSGKQCVFLPRGLENIVFFQKLWLKFQV